MKPYLRIFGIIAAAATLSACVAGNQTLPSNVQTQTAGSYVPDSGTSPCNIPGKWYMHGSCLMLDLNNANTTFTLPAYDGLALTVNVENKTTGPTVPFVVGDATGKHDITGNDGGLKFPLYGRTCVTTQGKVSKCPGRAALYFETYNASTTTVKLKASPAVVLTGGTLPGTTCALDYSGIDASTGKPAWVLSNITGKKKGDAVVIAELKAMRASLPAGKEFIWAIACY